ncbi:MAG: hypothetical protein JWN04_5841 [Myxococcaceae bacterium]|nr:hypothetical protein [Myxococcaceae bacterium]
MLARHWIASLLALLASCDHAASDSEAQRERGGHTELGAAADRAPADGVAPGCDEVPSSQELERYLKVVPDESEAGGLANGKGEWAAIVNRQGVLCAIAVSLPDPAMAWPGSQAVAKSKAYTANGYSTDVVPMSTARLYTLSQPGHSLAGVGAANPFNPECLSTPDAKGGVGKVCGGTIGFGGGVPLYKGKRRVGGLGVSGDTACADHEIAKRIRSAVKLDPPTGAKADDILYRGVDAPSIFGHPLCINTWRDGKKVGDEPLLAEELRPLGATASTPP